MTFWVLDQLPQQWPLYRKHPKYTIQTSQGKRAAVIHETNMRKVTNCFTSLSQANKESIISKVTFFFSLWWKVCMCFSTALFIKLDYFVQTQNQETNNNKINQKLLELLNAETKTLLDCLVYNFKWICSCMHVNHMHPLVCFHFLITYNPK